MIQSTTNFPAAQTKYTAKTKLFPFQRESVERAKQMNKGRCFLAHEQGLGKTLMAITFIIETNSFPAVVICPRILKDIWAQEFKTHYGKEVTILKGTKPPVAPLPDDNDRVYIINYDIVHAGKKNS